MAEYSISLFTESNISQDPTNPINFLGLSFLPPDLYDGSLPDEGTNGLASTGGNTTSFIYNGTGSSQTIKISDNESLFQEADSSGGRQVLAEETVFDGVTYSAGTDIATSYRLVLTGDDGVQYGLMSVSFSANSGIPQQTHGFVWYDPVNSPNLARPETSADFAPPAGTTLTVLSSANAIILTPACLCRGSRVLTVYGEVAVEELSVGDEVSVQGGVRRIRWIGSKSFGPGDLKGNPKLSPVCIQSGALGDGLPKRDLSVSRQHRMLVHSKIAERMFGNPEALIPAIKLTELPGVYIDEAAEAVEYFHILFDKHEVIYVEGAPTESLFTGPEALKAVSQEVREEILTIFPELADLDYTSEPVRFIPPGNLQKKLVVRHLKNSKSILDEAFDGGYHIPN